MGSKITRKIFGALVLSIAVGLIEAVIVSSTLNAIAKMIHQEQLPPQLATQFATLVRLDAQTLFIIIFIVGWIGAFVGFLAIIILFLILGFD